MSLASATSPPAPAPTRIFRFAVWSTWLSASLSMISGILLFLFYGLEVPRMIATAHHPGWHPSGRRNAAQSAFQEAQTP